MSPLERPRLRQHLAAVQDHHDPRYVYLFDKLGLTDQPRRVTRDEFAWMQLFDGERTLREIQLEAVRRAGGTLVTLDRITALAGRLDEALFLDGPRFRQRLAGPVREPSCTAHYLGDPTGLHRDLTALFTHPEGPGLPRERQPDGKLRAALIPHIDYGRGNVSYAWAYKAVAEQADAGLFVIIGTSHHSLERFTLTRKDFKTPLGTVPTDQAYIDRLVNHYGDGLFEDEAAHLPEHSIELEVVFLQYLYAGKRPFRIVPLVVGSFHDCVYAEKEPAEAPDVGRMIAALRQVEEETREPICYIISGDLAHIGPKFGDPRPVKPDELAHSREQDHSILRQAEAADPAGYFRVIAAESDLRRICGLPPTYTLLEAIRPGRGKLLHYGQYVHPRGFESVSFASVAFYR